MQNVNPKVLFVFFSNNILMSPSLLMNISVCLCVKIVHVLLQNVS